MARMDFHKWIEEQNAEEKARNWEKLKARMISEGLYDESKISKKRFNFRKWIPVMASCGAALVIGVSVGLYFILQKGDVVRYCTINDYEVIDENTTIKEYNKMLNQDLLYFDWYEIGQADTKVYKLIEDNNIIGYKEEIENGETGQTVTISIVSKKYEIDVYETQEDLCKSTTTFNGMEVYYKDNTFSLDAWFTYKDYKYYLETEKEPEDGDVLTSLLEELIPA